MKTRSEIQAEAQQLTILGRQYQNEQSQVVVSDAVIAMPRVLMTLPDAQLAARPVPVAEGEVTLTPRNVRHIEAALEGGELVFRLMERETNYSGTSDDAPSSVMSSRSAYDVLRTGYELGEEDRLAAELEFVAEGSEDRDELVDGESVAEVEAILKSHLLPHADRLRTKAEILDFLSGRMEPSAFIANAVERQCDREVHVELRARRHEIKLTIDES
jgi:hypothetical protein